MKPQAALALIGMTAALAGLAGFGASLTARAEQSNPSDSRTAMPGYVWSTTPIDQKIDSSRFISSAAFETSWANIATASSTGNAKAVAGIVDHHALAADLIGDFFQRLAAERPDVMRLIILSPDHARTDQPGATLIDAGYLTPDGEVGIDRESVHALLSTRLFMKDEGSTASREHGIGVLTPFIRRAYGGNIRILPLVISQKATTDDLRAFAGALTPFWDERTIIILSADLSHGLPRSEAEQRDTETLQWLSSLDATSTRAARDDHLDSSTNATILFTMMRQKGMKPQLSIFAHRNASDYGDRSNNITSYVTGVWRVK